MRANRTRQTFVLVFVDVHGLKRTNDEHGHTAGDQLLARVAATIRSRLRPYDLIVLYGGDELLCGLMDLKLDDTVERFALVNDSLIEKHDASVTAGVAQLQPGDQLQDLIERADAALYTARESRTNPTHLTHARACRHDTPVAEVNDIALASALDGDNIGSTPAHHVP